MYIQQISLERGKILQEQGQIIILDLSPKSLKDFPQGESWKENTTLLRKKYPSLGVESLTRFILPEYIIESREEIFNEDLPCVTWRYFYGVDSKRFNSLLSLDKIEYVYILTNPSFPGMVKIGMTKGEVRKRVDQLNKTSTLVEWEVRYSIALRQGTAFKVEQAVHRDLASFRISSNKGNKREFFYLTPEQALERVRSIGEAFLVENQ